MMNRALNDLRWVLLREVNNFEDPQNYNKAATPSKSN